MNCVWIKRINNAIQANSKKSETKLVGILYFLPGTLRQSLALNESNEIFKEGASISSVTYCFNHEIYLDFKKTNTSFQLLHNWCHCCPISPGTCCKRIQQQNILHFQLTNLPFFTSLESFLFPVPSQASLDFCEWDKTSRGSHTCWFCHFL